MINLTQQEKQVILFLSAVFLIGTAINFASKRYAPIKIFVCFDQNIGKIDVNSADKDTLMSVKGIGDKLAQRIIEFRSQNQKFNSIEELKNIKGLNNYRFEKIKDSVYVDKKLKIP